MLQNPLDTIAIKLFNSTFGWHFIRFYIYKKVKAIIAQTTDNGHLSKIRRSKYSSHISKGHHFKLLKHFRHCFYFPPLKSNSAAILPYYHF